LTGGAGEVNLFRRRAKKEFEDHPTVLAFEFIYRHDEFYDLDIRVPHFEQDNWVQGVPLL
jgi:hypothetical protein